MPIGPDKKRCGAQRVGQPEGVTCKMLAGYRTDHLGTGRCYRHGGCTPQQTKGAHREMAAAIVATYGEPQEGDPFDIIIAEIARTNGHVLWLGEIIAEMEAEALIWGKTEESANDGPMGGNIEKHAAGVNVWLQLYREERTHLVKVCKEAISVGIAERQVRLAEQTGQILAQVLKATLADPELGLAPALQEVALRVVSRHLRALPAA